jgi:hypothetical protein
LLTAQDVLGRMSLVGRGDEFEGRVWEVVV